jgi:hypothetical protein
MLGLDVIVKMFVEAAAVARIALSATPCLHASSYPHLVWHVLMQVPERSQNVSAAVTAKRKRYQEVRMLSTQHTFSPQTKCTLGLEYAARSLIPGCHTR